MSSGVFLKIKYMHKDYPVIEQNLLTLKEEYQKALENMNRNHTHAKRREHWRLRVSAFEYSIEALQQILKNERNSVDEGEKVCNHLYSVEYLGQKPRVCSLCGRWDI